jgi:LCP family protein required for cell wall assembly
MNGMPSRRAKILAWIAVAMTGVLVGTTLAVYVAVRLKLDKITHVQKIDLSNRPKRYNSALNILVLGSDTRAGKNHRDVGGIGCNCSDTIMLVHISPGRRKVVVLSIPRDTMVPTYRCSPWDGLPGQQLNLQAYERINGTLANGGPECVRHTVEQLTGIYINNFIQLDFTGFVKVINDIGGVNVCVPFGIHDPIVNLGNGQGHGTGLTLTAGRHHIWGRTALRFWRARYALADGTDTARIKRDQYLMAQIVKGVLHSGLLSSPSKLYHVTGDIAEAMTTDASTSELLNIVTSLSGVDAKEVQFVTAPYAPWPYDANELEFSQPLAGRLFSSIAHDVRLPKMHHGGSGGQAGGQPLTLSPSQVKVKVLNGSPVGQAAQVAAELASRGFDVVGTGNAARLTHVRTVIEYGSITDLAAADTLKKQFTSAQTRLDPSLAVGTIHVVIGSAFTALASPSPSPSPSATPSPSASAVPIGSLSGSFGGITGNVRCRNSAFYGPNSPAPTGKVPCVC